MHCLQVRHLALPPRALGGTCSNVTVLPAPACSLVNAVKHSGQATLPRSHSCRRCDLPVFLTCGTDGGGLTSGPTSPVELRRRCRWTGGWTTAGSRTGPMRTACAARSALPGARAGAQPGRRARLVGHGGPAGAARPDPDGRAVRRGPRAPPRRRPGRAAPPGRGARLVLRPVRGARAALRDPALRGRGRGRRPAAVRALGVPDAPAEPLGSRNANVLYGAADAALAALLAGGGAWRGFYDAADLAAAAEAIRAGRR